EIALVRLKYAVMPTPEQAPLLDALRTAALADQQHVADACRTARGTAPASATMLDRLQARLAIETARVAALNDVIPRFKAFYDSLTDAQKARLEQHRPWGATPRFERWRDRLGGMGTPMGAGGRTPWRMH